MNVESILYAVGSAPLFAARPFLAAALTCGLAKYGTHLPFLDGTDMVAALARSPAWFQHDATFAVLGVLAVLEVLSAKNPDVRALLSEFEHVLKSTVALVVSLGLLERGDAKLIQTLQQSLFGLHTLIALAVAGSVWVLSRGRAGALALIDDLDGENHLGLHSIVSWTENAWTFGLIVFIVVAPLVALVLSGLTVLGIHLWKRRAERKEEEGKLPCAGCGTRLRPHATRCHACAREVDAPRAVGVLGTPKEQAAPDRARHRFELAARKRCPTCASRLPERRPRQRCETCGTTTFASRAEFEAYLAVLHARLPRTLLWCAVLGLVPILGVIPAVIYYRLNLVSGLSAYVPPVRGCFTRLILRAIHWGLIALQPIPLVGALMVPLMALASYSIYRASLASRARVDLAAPALPQTA